MLDRIPDPYVFELSACIFQDSSGRFLLVKESGRTFHGLWSIPFEKLLPGETPLDAARRGLLEETGYEVKEVGVRCTYRAHNAKTGEYYNVHVFQITVAEKDNSVVPDSKEQRFFYWAHFLHMARLGQVREPGLAIRLLFDFKKGKITNPTFPAPEVSFMGNGHYHHATTHPSVEPNLKDRLGEYVPARAFFHPHELKQIAIVRRGRRIY
jgi:ADP-ribose pyrophosphatase YjhB (NUDIX family)